MVGTVNLSAERFQISGQMSDDVHCKREDRAQSRRREG